MARVGASPLGEAALPSGLGVPVRSVAGDGLLHPLALAAIAALLINDHVLKAAWPGPITGKISDFAGLVFFPLLLQAGWQLALAMAGRDSAATSRQAMAAILLTGFVFALVKVLPAANDVVSLTMGAGQWLVGRLIGYGPDHPLAVMMALDPTDLVALPFLLVAYAIRPGRHR